MIAKQQINQLLILLPEKELETLSSKINTTETPLWNYWQSFVDEMLFNGRSFDAINGIKDQLKDLIRHSSILTIESLTKENLKKYLRHTSEKRDWKAETYNTAIAKLGSFFKYLENENILEINPVKTIEKRKREIKNQLTLTKSQFNQIIGFIASQKKGLGMLRDKFFFMFLGLVGCRQGEALTIKITDIDMKKKTIRINCTKGAKPRVVSISENLQYALEEYLKYRKKLKREKEWLFISITQKNKPWTYSGVRKSLARISQKVGFQITTHSFRRFVATTLAEQKTPIEKIMQYIGHNNIKTTMRYINSLSPELTKECMTTLDNLLVDI